MERLSNIDILQRSCFILAECTQGCEDLQDIISRHLAVDPRIKSDMIVHLQSVDRLTQQIADLAAVLEKSIDLFENKDFVEKSKLLAETKLQSTRVAFGETVDQQNETSDVDFF